MNVTKHDEDYTGIIIGVILLYFFCVGCIVCVGLRAMLRCCSKALVTDATWPDQCPILYMFGWGFVGPLGAQQIENAWFAIKPPY